MSITEEPDHSSADTDHRQLDQMIKSQAEIAKIEPLYKEICEKSIEARDKVMTGLKMDGTFRKNNIDIIGKELNNILREIEAKYRAEWMSFNTIRMNADRLKPLVAKTGVNYREMQRLFNSDMYQAVTEVNVAYLKLLVEAIEVEQQLLEHLKPLEPLTNKMKTMTQNMEKQLKFYKAQVPKGPVEALKIKLSRIVAQSGLLDLIFNQVMDVAYLKAADQAKVAQELFQASAAVVNCKTVYNMVVKDNEMLTRFNRRMADDVALDGLGALENCKKPNCKR